MSVEGASARVPSGLIGRLAGWLMVRSGEGRMVIYLLGLHLIIGLGMAMGRSSSDALFFKRFGVEYLPHALFLTSLLLIAFSVVYASFVDRLRPARVFSIMFALFAIFLAATWLAMRLGEGVLAFAIYYLGYGVMSELLVAHFNMYAMSYLDALQAKRLFPLVGAAARLGAVLGGLGVGLVGGFVATEDIALGWALILALSMVMVIRRHRGEPASSGRARRGRKRHPLSEIQEGMRFARQSRLLRVTGAGVFVMIVLVSIQDYLASTILTRHFQDERELAAFFGWFFALTNGVVLLLQLFTTNRLLSRFGLQTVNLIFPWTTLGSLGLLSLSASFYPALLARFNYMGMLPAFRIPAANLFYNAMPAYMQGRARALTVGLVLPLGMAASGLLLMLVPVEAVDERLALFGLALAVLYIFLKARKNKLYAESLVDVIQQQVFIGKKLALEGETVLTPDVEAGIRQLMQSTQDETAVLTFADLLAEHAPRGAGPLLLEIAPGLKAAGQDRLLGHLARLRPPGWVDYAISCLDHPDHHLQATALRLLEDQPGAPIQVHVERWLEDGGPRLRAAAARHLAGQVDQGPRRRGREVLSAMLSEATDPANRLAALSAVASMGETEFLDRVEALLAATNSAVRAAAVHCYATLARRARRDAGSALLPMSGDPSPLVRAAWIASLDAVADPDIRLNALLAGLDDPDKEVRFKVRRLAANAMPASLDSYRKAIEAYPRHFTMQSLLCHCLGESGLAGRQDLLAATAARHIRTATEKKRLLLGVRMRADGGTDRSFLATVLDEEVQRHVDVVLEILSYLDETEFSQVLRAAMSSRNQRLRAQAIESVNHMENLALFKELLPLLEMEDSPAATQSIEHWASQPWTHVLDWCEREGSAWLADCARGLNRTRSA